MAFGRLTDRLKRNERVSLYHLLLLVRISFWRVVCYTDNRYVTDKKAQTSTGIEIPCWSASCVHLSWNTWGRDRMSNLQFCQQVAHCDFSDRLDGSQLLLRCVFDRLVCFMTLVLDRRTDMWYYYYTVLCVRWFLFVITYFSCVNRSRPLPWLIQDSEGINMNTKPLWSVKLK